MVVFNSPIKWPGVEVMNCYVKVWEGAAQESSEDKDKHEHKIKEQSIFSV